MRRRTERPSASEINVTFKRLGRKRRLVLRLEWLTLWPTCADFPVKSQRRDMAKTFRSGRESSAACPEWLLVHLKSAGPIGERGSNRQATGGTRPSREFAICLDRAKMSGQTGIGTSGGPEAPHPCKGWRQPRRGRRSPGARRIVISRPQSRCLIAMGAVLAIALVDASMQPLEAQGRLDARYSASLGGVPI